MCCLPGPEWGLVSTYVPRKTSLKQASFSLECIPATGHRHHLRMPLEGHCALLQPSGEAVSCRTGAAAYCSIMEYHRQQRANSDIAVPQSACTVSAFVKVPLVDVSDSDQHIKKVTAMSARVTQRVHYMSVITGMLWLSLVTCWCARHVKSVQPKLAAQAHKRVDSKFPLLSRQK